jgi:hypothetical protein
MRTGGKGKTKLEVTQEGEGNIGKFVMVNVRR